MFIADIYVFISRSRRRTTGSGGGGGGGRLIYLSFACLPGPPFAALGAHFAGFVQRFGRVSIRLWLRGSRLKLKPQTQPPRLVLLLQVNVAGERP